MLFIFTSIWVLLQKKGLKILKFRKMKAAGFAYAWRIPENEICWIYFAWGGISSAATNLHKIYQNRNELVCLTYKKVAGLNQM